MKIYEINPLFIIVFFIDFCISLVSEMVEIYRRMCNILWSERKRGSIRSHVKQGEMHRYLLGLGGMLIPPPPFTHTHTRGGQIKTSGESLS